MELAPGYTSNFLSSAELEAYVQHPHCFEIISKADAHINRLLEDLETEKARATTATINFEQRFHQLELSFRSSQMELKALNERHEAQTKEHGELVIQHGEAKARLVTLQSFGDEARARSESLQTAAAALQTEKKELLQIIEKKDREIERLNGEVQAGLSRAHELISSKTDLESKLTDLQSEKVATQFTITRLTREKDQAAGHAEWLSKELATKTGELLSARRDNSGVTLDFQTKLDAAQREAASLSDQLAKARERAEQQEAKIQSYLEELREAKNATATHEAQFREMVATKERLQKLYEEKERETQSRLRELESALSGMKTALEKTAESAQTREKELDERLRELSASTEQLKKERDEMRYQLDSAELIPSAPYEAIPPRPDASTPSPSGALPALGTVRPRSPTEDAPEDQQAAKRRRLSEMSATASVLATLQEGVGLTELYSKYEQATTKLRRTESENKRLNRYMQQILKEIEDKAPILQAQRKEYERGIKVHKQLTEQLFEAKKRTSDLEHALGEREDQVKHHLNEAAALRKETGDLGVQVQLLLKECQQRTIETATDPETVAAARLVTFRSIEELQQRNQELLRENRKLQAQYDRDRTAWQTDLEGQLKKRLESVMAEMEELRANQSRQAEMVKAVVRQRDMYRVLLSQADANYDRLDPGGVTALEGRAVARAVSPAAERAGEYPSMMAQLRGEFETYRKETETSSRMYRESIDTLRADASSTKLELAKAQSQAQFSSERYNLLTSSMEAQKRELERMTQRNLEFSAQVVDHQRRLDTLTHDLAQAREKTKQDAVLIENLRAEQIAFKGNEARLLAENKAMMSERSRLEALVNSLHTMHSSAESSYNDAKRRLSQHLEETQAEVAQLRQSLGATKEQLAQQTVLSEGQIAELRRKLDDRIAENLASVEKVVTLSARLEVVSAENARLSGVASSAERQLAIAMEREREKEPSEQENAAEVQQKLRMDLAAAQSELERVREELAAQTQHAAQYKAIAAQSEKAMRELSEVGDKYKEGVTAKIASLQEDKKSLTTRVSELEESLQHSAKAYTALQEEMNAQHTTLSRQVAFAEAKAQNIQKALDETGNTERALKEDVERHAALAKEAQANYERELVNHGNDVQALSRSKQELREREQELQHVRAALGTAEANLRSSQASWETQRAVLVKQQSELESRVEDLTRQNALLHSQLEKITTTAATQIRAAQEAGIPAEARREDGEAPTAAEKSVEELREVVRFLRRELDLSECKYELTRQEAERYRQQADLAARSLETLRAELTAERSRGPQPASEAEHKKLLEQIEQMNLLRESNVTLREENRHNVERLKEYEERALATEARLEPLLREKRQLAAVNLATEAERDGLIVENARWKKRVEQLLEKYQRIDPSEHEDLVKREAESKAALAELQDKMAKLKEESKGAIEKAEALQKEVSSKDGIIKLHEARRKKETEAAAKAKTDLEAEVEKLKAEVERQKAEAERLRKEAAANVGKAPAAVAKGGDAAGSAQQAEKIKALEAEVVASQARVTKMTGQIDKAKLRFGKDKERIAELEKQLAERPAGEPGAEGAAPVASGGSNAALEERIRELEREKETLEGDKKKLAMKSQKLLERVHALSKVGAVVPPAAPPSPLAAEGETGEPVRKRRRTDEEAMPTATTTTATPVPAVTPPSAPTPPGPASLPSAPAPTATKASPSARPGAAKSSPWAAALGAAPKRGSFVVFGAKSAPLSVSVTQPDSSPTAPTASSDAASQATTAVVPSGDVSEAPRRQQRLRRTGAGNTSPPRQRVPEEPTQQEAAEPAEAVDVVAEEAEEASPMDMTHEDVDAEGAPAAVPAAQEWGGTTPTQAVPTTPMARGFPAVERSAPVEAAPMATVPEEEGALQQQAPQVPSLDDAGSAGEGRVPKTGGTPSAADQGQPVRRLIRPSSLVSPAGATAPDATAMLAGGVTTPTSTPQAAAPAAPAFGTFGAGGTSPMAQSKFGQSAFGFGASKPFSFGGAATASPGGARTFGFAFGQKGASPAMPMPAAVAAVPAPAPAVAEVATEAPVESETAASFVEAAPAETTPAPAPATAAPASAKGPRKKITPITWGEESKKEDPEEPAPSA